MKYVFLFCGTTEQQQEWDKMSQEELHAQYAKVGQWFVEYGSKLGNGNELQSPQTATTVLFQRNGEAIVRDGPFIEGKEVIGGYVEVNVADLDEALRLAKSWPGGAVEIRPVAAHSR